MQTQSVKTTIELTRDILYLAKMKALKERKTLKAVITESLLKELSPKKLNNKRNKLPIKIGGYKLGGIKGGLRRVDIYEDF